MGIQTKVAGVLILILVAIFTATTWISTHQTTGLIAAEGHAADALMKKEVTNTASTLFSTCEEGGWGFMENGNVDQFQKLIKKFGTFKGVEEIGLANGGGKIVYTSNSESTGQPFDTAVFQNAAGQKGVFRTENADGLLFTHARHFGKACLGCHMDKKEGELAGVLYLRYSLNELRQMQKANVAAVAKAEHQSWLTGLLTALGGLALAALAIYLLLGSMVRRPLGNVVGMLEEIGKGRLGRRLNLQSDDEIGHMGTTLDRLADTLQNDMVASLTKLANGDITFDVTPHDGNDEVRGALKRLGEDLNDVLGRVQSAGEQIAAGSTQVADSSQSLSQGATEQASSLEEISSSMTQMGSQTKHNAENASLANQLSSEARDAAQNGNQQMGEMVRAMEEIRESGQNISKIIKVIDEIAFQTNLLALNAAVEAARAGQHGKGFAVVAEEVRNLAARSAKAARETAELIEGSVSKTRTGADIATRTASALDEIVQSVSKVNDLVAEIAAASNEQAQGIGQVSVGLEQIDQVTQQTTASAEESAAAAQELSSQANELRQLLKRFHLKNARVSSLPAPPRSMPAQSRKPEPPPQPKKEISWGWESDDSAAAQPASGGPDPSAIIALDDSEFGRY